MARELLKVFKGSSWTIHLVDLGKMRETEKKKSVDSICRRGNIFQYKSTVSGIWRWASEDPVDYQEEKHKEYLCVACIGYAVKKGYAKFEL